MKRLNLLGTWAPSCSAPPSASNPYLVYLDDGRGTVGRKLDRGPEYDVLGGRIDSARQLAPGKVALTVRNADPNWQQYDGMVFETEVEFSSTHTRTLRSTASDGKVFIADGKLNDGRDIPTLTRCK
jgi:hypothetical protein